MVAYFGGKEKYHDSNLNTSTSPVDSSLHWNDFEGVVLTNYLWDVLQNNLCRKTTIRKLIYTEKKSHNNFLLNGLNLTFTILGISCHYQVK